MSDPGNDPLIASAAEALRGAIPVRPGLPDRTLARGRRHRRRQQVAVVASITFALMVVLGRPHGADAREVTFALDAPDSRGVEVVGDFTGWKDHAIPLRRDGRGRWQATVSLPPGRYRFAYLVDGREWRADPHATRVSDDFGQATSVLTVAN